MTTQEKPNLKHIMAVPPTSESRDLFVIHGVETAGGEAGRDERFAFAPLHAFAYAYAPQDSSSARPVWDRLLHAALVWAEENSYGMPGRLDHVPLPEEIKAKVNEGEELTPLEVFLQGVPYKDVDDSEEFTLHTKLYVKRFHMVLVWAEENRYGVERV